MPTKAHVGKAGHLAVMAEYLLRGYNVAMPEVDEGDDIFVVHGRSGELWRVQVKTAIGRPARVGHRGKFAVGRKQLAKAKEPDLWYVFACRRGTWWEFAVFPRDLLHAAHIRHGVGSVSEEKVILAVHFTESAVRCSGRDWQTMRNNWDEWPILA